MNKFLTIIVVVLFTLTSHSYSLSKKSFVPILFSPSQITNLEKGQSASYSFPGFFSQYGQLNLIYANSHKDTYFIGFGAMFVLVGLNKHLIENNTFDTFANISIGRSFDGYLGDLGLSILKKINADETIGFSLDSYFHHGYNGLPILGYVTYRRGIAGIVAYTMRFSKKALVKFNIGASFIQYRYMCDYDGIECNGHKYVTYYTENNNVSYLKSPSWDNHFVFPLGITLSYSLR